MGVLRLVRLDGHLVLVIVVSSRAVLASVGRLVQRGTETRSVKLFARRVSYLRLRIMTLREEMSLRVGTTLGVGVAVVHIRSEHAVACAVHRSTVVDVAGSVIVLDFTVVLSSSSIPD